MCIGRNSIDEALWDIESYIMNREGVDASRRLMSPLNWYVETGRASTQFLRWLVEREREESSRTQGLYFYGMRLRGFSPGCQPMEGFAYRLDDPYGSYHDILAYKRKLSDKECEDYDLTYIKENREE